ncbi:NAD(P)-binding protein [Pleurostoma richardsiae]|uniref:NAD(P)-binding protein n=1 Tax=Pleurostoma richardsiae TaxID=41990 RepID=A0AA38RIN4_9PEZI|nr:NAD(P)-binding protein [Pleurostoma richardsiae]
MPTFTIPKRPLTWLVTGSSSGLGLEIVRQVQGRGHRVIATSRNPARTPELVCEVEAKGGKWVQLDVDDLDSIKLADELDLDGEQIDVLVNNAGYSIYQVGEHLTEDEVRVQMDTLYFAPFRLMRAVLPYMRKRRFGTIVNISSGASLEGRESMCAYAGPKAALDGLSRVLAKEVASFNIRILTVVLGVFNTNMMNTATMGKMSIDDDYRGSVADETMKSMASSAISPDGDKVKAAKAICDVVLGECVGAGHEGEPVLPLGRDMVARFKLARDKLDHALRVFEGVATSVYIEK